MTKLVVTGDDIHLDAGASDITPLGSGENRSWKIIAIYGTFAVATGGIRRSA